MSDSLELVTLKKCTSQLEAIFTSNIKKVAGYLLHMKIINEAAFDVVDSESDSVKASHLVQEVIARVQVEPRCYYQLINYLRQEYGDIADELDAEYFGTSSASTHSLNRDSLLKALSEIRDKWRILGKVLKVPDDLLAQFVDLSYPLLEVIVYWMRGRKTTSVSWDAVVMALRTPNLNECELADKINSLYCNQKQERSTATDDSVSALIGSSSDSVSHNPLHVAARNGHLDVVRNLIEEQGYDSCSTDASLETPLHHAATEGHLEVVKYLTQEQECNSLCQDNDGKTPFFMAAEKGYLDILVLLSLNASSEPLTKDGRNSLHAAAIGGHLAVVQYLVESCGYDPTCFDHLKNTPLHYAAQHGHVSIIQYLVQDKKSNLASFNEAGRTPLHVASQNGCVEAVKCILTLSNGDERCDKFGCNALHVAVINGKLDIVQHLVEEQGYDVSFVDLAGNTSLHHAAISGHLPVVNYLITAKKCDPLAKNKNGNTPLQCAIKSGKLDVVEVLCGLKPDDVGPSALLLAITHGHLSIAKYLIDSVGCSLSCVDDSMAPLHNAAAIGNSEIVKYLIDDRKCDPMMRCPSNLFTPLHYASLNGHLNIVQYYVKELTCDPTVQDKTNTTPLHLAASNGHLEIVKYLVSIGSPLLFNDSQCLPISFASCGGHVEVMKFLEPYNDIFAVDINGWSCLHHAADKGHLKAVRYLIEERLFVPSIQDYSKVTPLHLAAWRGHLPVISYLILDKGCNPQSRDSALDTPLHWAASEGQLEVVQFFAMIGTSLQVQGENTCTPLDYAILYGHESVAEFLCNSLFE